MAMRLIIDLSITALMLTAFAYHLTGNFAHEVIGVILLIGLIVHIVVNRRWFLSLFKVPFSFNRAVILTANTLLLISICTVMATGIMISHDLFPFAAADGLKAREIHMASAYWTLVLMSVHVGLYWDRVGAWMSQKRLLAATATKLKKCKPILAVGIICLGVKASFERAVGSKLIQNQAFDFWDFDNSTAYFFLLYISIIAMYAVMAHYIFSRARRYLR